MKLRKFLCPTDFSDNSLSGVRYALALARQLGGTLDLLHVHHVPFHHSDVNAPTSVEALPDELKAELERSLEDMVGELGADAEGVKVTTSLRVGVPYEEIGAHVEATDPDVIVMSTLGRSGIARALLGSVTERVLRLSGIPVLSVRA
ncbi:MAG: universal stress protein [Myxococcales bacterium]|nr:universal stress protein [Myxococcales bacterium]